jgi:carbonic anhydrase/acetyltransferase-like protein (isoleucine patch superfamily)
MAVYQLDDLAPSIDASAYVAESAEIIGDVTLQADTSIWPHVTLRGDNAPIVIGAGSNIQDGSVLHVDKGHGLTIGPNVTVGHQAMLHGCTVQEGALVGIQAIVLNDAVIGRNCLIGAGAIVPEGRVIPDNSLVVGVGKVVRELTPEEITNMHNNTRNYVLRAQQYKRGLKRVG